MSILALIFYYGKMVVAFISVLVGMKVASIVVKSDD